MKENRVKVCFYVFLIVVLTLPIHIDTSKADVMSVDARGTGNFLPVENCSLIMTDANVIFDIKYPNLFSKIDLNFNGNYTIYNPNESLNITLVAPFSPDFNNLEAKCVIKIEETIVPFSVVESYIDDNPWEEYIFPYIDMHHYYSRSFIVFNISIAKNNSIEIEFNFEATLSNRFSDSSNIVRIFYDVGTSRAWNGTITERVEFNVHGKLPDSYSKDKDEDFENNCIISNIENDRCYAWEWENKRIMINSVYISYDNPWNLFRRFLPVIIIASFIAIPIIIIGTRRRREKRKNILETGSNDIQIYYKNTNKL